MSADLAKPDMPLDINGFQSMYGPYALGTMIVVILSVVMVGSVFVLYTRVVKPFMDGQLSLSEARAREIAGLKGLGDGMATTARALEQMAKDFQTWDLSRRQAAEMFTRQLEAMAKVQGGNHG